MASTMGTAPRSPAQLTSTRSTSRNRIHPIDTSTASGRATRTSTTATPNAAAASASRRLGNTSRPSSRNNPICAVDANPSRKVRTARRRDGALAATTMPATYTARKPDIASAAAPP